MESRLDPYSDSKSLPAQRIDAQGGAHVDLRAVLALALPLVATAPPARSSSSSASRHRASFRS